MQRLKILARHLSSATKKPKSQKPVCLVLGAGRGIGGNVAQKFALEGYHSVLIRRSDSSALSSQVKEIQDAGGDASGFLVNAINDGAIEELVDNVEANIGEIAVTVYNLGAQVGTRSLEDTTLKTFEQGWKLGCQGLFRLAKAVCPLMVKRGHGTILVTSATSAVRGNAGQHSHAAAMGARRLLSQTLHAEFAPDNIHIAHIVIDGAVDAPDTLGKMLGPERYQQMREAHGLDKDGLLVPSSIADTFWHLSQQHRSAWTFEMDLRSYSDVAWWNSPVNMNVKGF